MIRLRYGGIHIEFKLEKRAPIGLFDSGVGGVSVLHEAAKLLPGEDFIYYGDNANAPYGTRTPEEIRRLSFSCASILHEKGVKAMLVACNTATSAAIADMRAEYQLPVISMEPAVKPACAAAGSAKVLVMATPATLRQQRYKDLVQRMPYPRNVLDVPCGPLVTLVEHARKHDNEIFQYLKTVLLPYASRDVRAIVLGCTHFVFVKQAVQIIADDLWGRDMAVIHGNVGTANQLKSVLEQQDLLNARVKGGSVSFFSSAGDVMVRQMQMMFQELKIKDQ